MPKVRPLTENARRDRAIKAQIVGLMKVEGLSSQEMADKLGVSLNTFYRHRNEPEMMTLREQRLLLQIFPEINIQ